MIFSDEYIHHFHSCVMINTNKGAVVMKSNQSPQHLINNPNYLFLAKLGYYA